MTRHWRHADGSPFRTAPEPFPTDVLSEPIGLGSTIWRYGAAFGLRDPASSERLLGLGEGGTPLRPFREGSDLLVKVEYASPTGSFKDRGAAVVIAHAVDEGADSVLCDSSGNAGTAVAAYAARAGLPCDVFVPGITGRAKTAPAVSHGARVVRVDGDRAAAAEAAESVATRGDGFYASHVWHPSFVDGTKTFAFELWEQLGRTPERLVLPVGNGTLVLGAWRGFEELRLAGLIDTVPPIVAVQAETCRPIVDRALGRAPSTPGQTVADGIAVANPPRRDEIIDAVVASGGEFATVTDHQVIEARTELARAGWFVEPTGAVAFAEARRRQAAGPTGELVVPLCGSGLKSVS
jgi:threonine synthase